MSPARTRAEAVTREYKVHSTWQYGKSVFIELLGASTSEGDYWNKTYGLMTIIVPYDKAADYLPGTVCEVTIVNKKKSDAQIKEELEKELNVIRPIGTTSVGPR